MQKDIGHKSIHLSCCSQKECLVEHVKITPFTVSRAKKGIIASCRALLEFARAADPNSSVLMNMV